MKILAIHADYLNFEAKKQAIKDPEPIDNPKESIKECLVVFMAVEKDDEQNPENIVQQLTEQVKDIATQIKAESIVLYPYAHLSSNLGSPKVAKEILEQADKALKADGFQVKRSPFGWYKSFEISCKGHPLSELSREIKVKDKVDKGMDKKFEYAEQSLNKEQQVKLSAAFFVAQALKEAFPKAELGVVGFYQDKAFIDIANVKVKGDDLKQFDNRIKKLLKQEQKIEETSIPEGYQAEIAKDLGATKALKLGDVVLVPPFHDPFVQSTKEIGAFMLVDAASAYWKNNANNQQLTRLYFVAFENKEQLQTYKDKVAEAEARDHRKIGEQLNMFSFHKEAPGMPFFHDRGMYLYRQLEQFMVEEMTKLNYEFLRTPLILNKALWLQSGHWDHYRENMYFTKIDGGDYAVKPMNCPGHILIFKDRPHSYKELPIKAGEFGLVHRHELSGVLSGLFRVRYFTQDDAHVFCTEEQLQDQIKELIQLVQTIYSAFGFEYHLELSTKPAKAMGDPKLWGLAEKSLGDAMKSLNLDFKVNPGDGAFYGPKIDCHVKDALGRSWQCGTIQLDFSMPEKFDLMYEGSDSKRHRPVMLHRAIYGSFERFLGILVEHFAGKFPLWLSPVPVKLVTVTDRSVDFAKEVRAKLFAAGIVRAEVDSRTETLGKKIRDAQLEKTNYIVTIGDMEAEEKTLAIRSRDGNVSRDVPVDKFIEDLLKEIAEKRL